MLFLGIDPGSSGAIAAINELSEVVGIVKNSVTERDLYLAIWSWSSDFDIAQAVLERVSSMPKQGVASSFKFGVSYGFLRGILIASEVRFFEVLPREWQAKMKCRTGGDKNISKARAQQLFPGEKITHANADALLLAEYARITWNEQMPVPATSLRGPE